MGHDYIATAQTLPIYETAKEYKGPVLVIHSTWDVVVPYTYGERYHQVYKNSQLILLPRWITFSSAKRHKSKQPLKLRSL